MTRLATALLVCLLALSGISGAVVADVGDGGGVAQATPVDPAPVAAADDGQRRAATGTLKRGSLTVRNVSFEPSEPLVNSQVTFTATVANDGTVPVRVDKVAIDHKNEKEDNNPWVDDEKIANRSDFRTLEPGETLTVELRARFEEVGPKILKVEASGLTRIPGTEENDSVSTYRSFTLETRTPPRPILDINPRDMKANEDGRLPVEVSYSGDRPLENVELRLTGSGLDIQDPTRATATLDPGTHRYVFNVSSENAGDRRVGLVMDYAVAGNAERISTSATLSFDEPATADITLSNLNTQREGDKVYISGRVGNGGEVDANGIRVSVVETDGVTPAPPQKSYFIGGVEPDKNGRFELYATVDNDTTSIPIRINYSSNGIDKTIRTSVSYTPPTTTVEEEDSAAGTVFWLFGGVIVLLVFGLMGYAWHNADDDESDEDRSGEAPISTDPTDGTSAIDGAGGSPDGTLPQGQTPRRGGGQPGTHNQALPRGQTGQHAQGNQPAAQNQPRADPGSARPTSRNGHGGGHPNSRGQTADDHHQNGHQQAQGSKAPPRQNGSPEGQRSRTQEQPGRSRGQHDNESRKEEKNGHHAGDQGASETQQAETDPGSRAGSTATETATGTTSDETQTVTCDGCGEAFDTANLGRVDLDDGEAATACEDCQRRALAATRRRLGANENRGRPEVDGVDQLIDKTGSAPPCDGCGEDVPTSDLEKMTLPDGSSAIACSTCREAALDEAKRQLTAQVD